MRRRGFSIMEVLSAMLVLLMVIMGSTSLMLDGIHVFAKTTTDADLNDSNSQGIRRVALTVRSAVAVSTSTDGATLTYNLPTYNSTTDSVTGEKELTDPVVSDGVSRTFVVNFQAGTLTDTVTGRVLVKNILATDPEPTSSNYGKAYLPFTITTVGTSKAITINLITQSRVGELVRYVRLKTTAVVRNG